MKKVLLTLLISSLLGCSAYAYTVKQGDTLSKIAKSLGVSYQQLAEENGIENPNLIYPGQEISTGLGSAIPETPALIDAYLISGISNTDTSMTISSGVDKGGNPLSGYMCFVIDVNTPTVEYVCGTASGASITSMSRGVDLTNPNATSSSLAFSHRRFASVQISDYPTLQFIVRQLNGLDTTNGGLLFGTNKISGLYTLNGSFDWLKYNTSTSMLQWSNDGVNYYDFTSTTITQLTASSTAGIGVQSSKIYVNASSTTGLAFSSGDGSVYQKVNNATSIYQIEQTATTTSIGLGSSSYRRLAETFRPAQPIITGVSLGKWTNILTPTSTITISLQALSSGNPSGTMLASTTVTSSTWNGLSNGMNSFTFNTPYTADVNTTYAIVAQTDSYDASNYYSIGYTSSGTSYPYGNAKYYTGSSWTNLTGDLAFRVITDQPYGGVESNWAGMYLNYNKDNDWNGTNTFNGTTILATSTTYIGSTSTNILVSGGNAATYHYHLATSTLYASSTVTSHTFTLPHSLGTKPRILRGNLVWGDTSNQCYSSGIATINNNVITQSYLEFVPKIAAENGAVGSNNGIFLYCLTSPSSASVVSLAITSVSETNIVFDVIESGASKTMYMNLEISN